MMILLHILFVSLIEAEYFQTESCISADGTKCWDDEYIGKTHEMKQACCTRMDNPQLGGYAGPDGTYHDNSCAEMGFGPATYAGNSRPSQNNPTYAVAMCGSHTALIGVLKVAGHMGCVGMDKFASCDHMLAQWHRANAPANWPAIQQGYKDETWCCECFLKTREGDDGGGSCIADKRCAQPLVTAAREPCGGSGPQTPGVGFFDFVNGDGSVPTKDLETEKELGTVESANARLQRVNKALMNALKETLN